MPHKIFGIRSGLNSAEKDFFAEMPDESEAEKGSVKDDKDDVNVKGGKKDAGGGGMSQVNLPTNVLDLRSVFESYMLGLKL